MAANDGDADWRRLASDRNVSHGVARAMWEQARDASPDDLQQAEQTFHLMLDEAEAANITHEPGRETLAQGTPSPRDAASLGPGKWTRVLLEQPKPAPAVAPGSERRPTADSIKADLAAAGQAGKDAVAAIAASDPETIVAALKEISKDKTGFLGKLMSIATTAVERVIEQRKHWDVSFTPAKPPQPAKPREANDDQGDDAPVTEDDAPVAAAPPPAAPPDKPDEDSADEAPPDHPA